MTKNQALLVSNYCGILYGSKQISFGVANRLASNSKTYSNLQKEVEEIRQRGVEKQASTETVNQEIDEFLKSDFEGLFKTIDLSVVENLAYEEIPVTLTVGEEKIEQNWKISDMLIVLQELEIIK